MLEWFIALRENNHKLHMGMRGIETSDVGSLEAVARVGPVSHPSISPSMPGGQGETRTSLFWLVDLLKGSPSPKKTRQLDLGVGNLQHKHIPKTYAELQSDPRVTGVVPRPFKHE